MHFFIYLILILLIAYYSFKTYIQSITQALDHPNQIRFRWRGSFLKYLF